jgi:hypothetical protein
LFFSLLLNSPKKCNKKPSISMIQLEGIIFQFLFVFLRV